MRRVVFINKECVMKLAMRVQAVSKKVTLITTAFVLAVSTLTAVVPFILSQDVNAISSVDVANLDLWDLRNTRATGHNKLVSSGLHVWTEGTTSTDKAAGYYPVNFNLSSAKDFNLSWNGSANTPGGQLVVDLNNNGVADGILVVEPIYGGNIWLSERGLTTADGIDLNSLPLATASAGSDGGDYSGTFNDWLALFPNAKVMNIGYSLGSGLLGDGIISNIKVNGTNYSFIDTTAPVITINGATTAKKVYPAGTVRIQVTDPAYSKTVIQQKNLDGNYTDRFTYDASKGKSFKIEWLGDGEYRVQAFDDAGNGSKVLAFAIDTTAPQTTFNTPAAGQTVGHSFTLSGKATDNIGLNRVYVQLVNRENNQRYAGQTISLSGTEQDWTYAIDANTLNLPEGTYAAHVSVVDNIGNTSSVGWTADFKLDKTVPVFEITNIHEGDVIKTQPSNKIIVNGSLTDAAGAYAFLQLVKDGVSRGGVTAYAQVTNGVLGQFDATNLEDGHYQLFSTPTDYLGNAIARSVINFTIDNTAPVVSKAILNGTTISGQYQRNDNCTPINKMYPVSGALNLTSVINDTNGVTSASYSVRKLLDNGCTDTATYRSATIALQQSTKNLSNWNQPTNAMLDTKAEGLNGKYAIVLVTKDGAGNETVKYIDLNIDNTGPVAPTLVSPAANVYQSGDPIQKWTHENPSDVDHYVYESYSDASLKSLIIQETTPATQRTIVGAQNNAIWWRVAAVDTMGNQGAWSAVYKLTIDNKAPVVTLNDLGTAPIHGSVTVTGHISENFQLANYNLSIYNGTVNLADGETHTSSRISIPGWTTTDYTNGTTVPVSRTLDTTQLDDGTYQIRLAARDAAGNRSSTDSVKYFTFVVDNHAPTAEPVTYSTTNLTNQPVTATLKLDGAINTPLGWTPTDATNTVFTKEYNENTTEEVAYTDSVGNTGSAQVSITWIDTVAPKITSPITNNATIRGTAVFSVNDPSAVVQVNGTETTSRQVSGDGTYTVVATDAAGNKSNPFKFTINNAQTITLNPIDPQSSTPRISGSALWVVDPASVGAVSVNIDGNPYAATIDAAGNWFFQVVTPLSNGPHTITVNNVPFDFTSTIPVTFTTPSITGPTADALGASTDASRTDSATKDAAGAPAVEGTSTEKNLAEAATANTDGNAFGLAWYWWLLIVAGAMTLVWWIVAAVRSSRAQA